MSIFDTESDRENEGESEIFQKSETQSWMRASKLDCVCASASRSLCERRNAKCAELDPVIRCFSIVAQTRSLDIETDTAAARDLWYVRECRHREKDDNSLCACVCQG